MPRRWRFGQCAVQQASCGLRCADVRCRLSGLSQPSQHPAITSRAHPGQMRGDPSRPPAPHRAHIACIRTARDADVLDGHQGWQSNGGRRPRGTGGARLRACCTTTPGTGWYCGIRPAGPAADSRPAGTASSQPAGTTWPACLAWGSERNEPLRRKGRDAGRRGSYCGRPSAGMPSSTAGAAGAGPVAAAGGASWRDCQASPPRVRRTSSGAPSATR